MIQHITRLRCMFGYYRGKHSDLMIQVNNNKSTVINLDLGTAFKAEPIEEKRSSPVITRFDDYVGSSEEESEELHTDPMNAEIAALTSESSIPRSRSAAVDSSQKSKSEQLDDESGSSDEEEGESDVDDSAVSGRVEIETDNNRADIAADFDDIEEAAVEPQKDRIKDSKPRGVGFVAQREKVSADKFKKDFL